MASNHITEAPMDTSMAESRTSGEDSQPPAETGINPSDLPQEEPKFFCACRRPALKQISSTARNPGRRFFSCYSRKDICKVWIWEDLLQQYVEKMVDYNKSTTHDMAIQELAIVREKLNARDKQINELKEKCLSYEDYITVLGTELKCAKEERDVAFEESAKAREELKARDKQTNELAKIDDNEALVATFGDMAISKAKSVTKDDGGSSS
ncbi:RNase H-like protein [Panicum miliaceum]|uniref:RNase H-like protein n=1 Tax=Panicum miliaceum TaxID=4540 RepID=A0A3L6TBI5_PANMI|nr:RNase H-like protein [Panicum miliaceum]